jgi:hypothetical protein
MNVFLTFTMSSTAEYLELKHLGSKPYRKSTAPAVQAAAMPRPVTSTLTAAPAVPVALPQFINKGGYQCCFIKTPSIVKAVLDDWQESYSVGCFFVK